MDFKNDKQVFNLWFQLLQYRCDRILWLGKGIKQLSYNRAEIWLSDHRPVSSAFLIAVEVLDQRKLRKALNVNSAVVHPEIFQGKDES